MAAVAKQMKAAAAKQSAITTISEHSRGGLICGAKKSRVSGQISSPTTTAIRPRLAVLYVITPGPAATWAAVARSLGQDGPEAAVNLLDRCR